MCDERTYNKNVLSIKHAIRSVVIFAKVVNVMTYRPI